MCWCELLTAINEGDSYGQNRRLAANPFAKDALLILSNHGADIHTQNKDNESNILSEKIDHYYYDDCIDKAIVTINTLLQIGVSPAAVNKDGETAIKLAKDKPEIFSVLKPFELKKLIKSTISESQHSVTKTRLAF
jgi:hypothetical protein